ncbi:MAG: hypothetical protein RRY53_08060, partial [Pseudoflavonifractor sp.]
MVLALAMVFSLITFGAPLKASAAPQKTNFGSGTWDATIKTPDVYQAGTTGWVQIKLLYMNPDGSVYEGNEEAVIGEGQGGVSAGYMGKYGKILEHPSYLVSGFRVFLNSALNDWLPEFIEVKLPREDGTQIVLRANNYNNVWFKPGVTKDYDFQS